jgi:hypothetical protein
MKCSNVSKVVTHMGNSYQSIGVKVTEKVNLTAIFGTSQNFSHLAYIVSPISAFVVIPNSLCGDEQDKGRSMRAIASCAIVTLLLCVCNSRGVFAQTPPAPSRIDVQSVKAFRDSIKRENEEISLLQHLLEAATVERRILQHSNVRAWVVGNPAVRDSVFYALIQADSSVESEAGTEAEVLATPTGDLIQVRFGTAVFKGATLKDALDKSSDKDLYQKVADSYRYSKDIELRDESSRLPTPLRPELIRSSVIPATFSPMVARGNPRSPMGHVNISLYDIAFRSGPDWGGEVRLGTDEICFPFWSSGQTSFLATYDNVKFGIALPFIWGRNSSDLFPPFLLRGRTLNGTRGVVGEFDFGPIGGYLSATQLTKNDQSHLTDPNDFYYVTGIGQLFYSFAVNLDLNNLVRIKVGFGIHRVSNARIVTTPLTPGGTDFHESLDIKGVQNLASPLLKFDFINRSVTDKFTASLTYYNLTLMLTGSMELVPGVLSLEAKYAVPIASTLDPWVSPDLFVFSPRLTIRW